MDAERPSRHPIGSAYTRRPLGTEWRTDGVEAHLVVEVLRVRVQPVARRRLLRVAERETSVKSEHPLALPS